VSSQSPSHRATPWLRPFKAGLVSALCAILLAACGGPSDSDVEKAVRDEFAANKQAMTAILGPGAGGALAKEMENNFARTKISVGEKTKLADGGYSVVVTLKTPDGSSDTMTVRLAKGADKWVVQ